MNYEYHKEGLKVFQETILEYLSYILNTLDTYPISGAIQTSIYKIEKIIDFCLEKEDITFEKVEYITQEIISITQHLIFNEYEVMNLKKFLIIQDRDKKLVQLGI